MFLRCQTVEESSQSYSQEAVYSEKEVVFRDFVSKNIGSEAVIANCKDDSHDCQTESPKDKLSLTFDSIGAYNINDYAQDADDSPGDRVLYRFTAKFSFSQSDILQKNGANKGCQCCECKDYYVSNVSCEHKEANDIEFDFNEISQVGIKLRTDILQDKENT